MADISLIKSYKSNLRNIMIIMSYLYNEHKKNMCIYYDSLKRIVEIDYKIAFISYEIENIEDPIARPLGTGDENYNIEKIIRTSESKIKYLEGDRLLIQAKIAESLAKATMYEDEITNKREQFDDIKSKIKDIENPEAEEWLRALSKKANSISAEYKTTGSWNES